MDSLNNRPEKQESEKEANLQSSWFRQIQTKLLSRIHSVA